MEIESYQSNLYFVIIYFITKRNYVWYLFMFVIYTQRITYFAEEQLRSVIKLLIS